VNSARTMDILSITEKQGGPALKGGWQKDMARRRYQKGNLRKRGKRSPVWELQWWEDYIRENGSIGRRRQSAVLGFVSSLTQRQARKLAEDRLRPINQELVLPQSTQGFGDFVARYFVPLFFPTLKPSTQKRYRQTLTTHLLPAFGSSRLCDIGSVDLQRFVLQKMERGLGWESANHLRNLVSKVFERAKQWNCYSGINPASGVLLPEKVPVREKRALTPNQIPCLLESLKEPARTTVLLGILTGMRVGEILGLRRKDVDFLSGQIRIEQANYRGVFGTPKTKGSKRSLPIPKALAAPLARICGHCARSEDETLVFRTRYGKPLSDSNLLHRHLKPAGAKIAAPWLNWHTLRRTHATLLQVAGASLKDAQAQLGHSKMSTTLEVYTVPIPAHLRVAVENLSQLVTNGDEFGPIAEGTPTTVQ
jgi:integrase